MELQYIKNDPNYKKERGMYVCSYNPECRCLKRDCYRCGWNPKVAQARKEAMHERI